MRANWKVPSGHLETFDRDGSRRSMTLGGESARHDTSCKVSHDRNDFFAAMPRSCESVIGLETHYGAECIGDEPTCPRAPRERHRRRHAPDDVPCRAPAARFTCGQPSCDLSVERSHRMKSTDDDGI